MSRTPGGKRRATRRALVARRVLLVLLLASLLCWTANTALAPAAHAAPPRLTVGTRWTPDVGLALVLGGHLEILRAGRATVVASSSGISAMSWSSDGQWVAFERHGGKTASVWVVGVNGFGLREVGSGAVVCYGWSTSGDVLAVAAASGGPRGTSVIRALSLPSGRLVVQRLEAGEVESIVASRTQLAFDVSSFEPGIGFVKGSLRGQALNGGKSRIIASSSTSSYDPLGFSPDGETLLYAIDPMNSASIAADGLRVRVESGTGGRVVGTALVDPGSWAWSLDSAYLAITLGNSHAAWATDKHIWACRLPIGDCREQDSPAGTISFDPSYGSRADSPTSRPPAEAARAGSAQEHPPNPRLAAGSPPRASGYRPAPLRTRN